MRSREERPKKPDRHGKGKIIIMWLLFMPLFAIITTTLVSTFNMSAKQESEIVYKYKTNEVNSVNDLVNGNIYHFEIENDSIDSYIIMNTNTYYTFKFINIDYYDFSDYSFDLDEVIPSTNQQNSNISLDIQIRYNSTAFSIYLNNSGDYFTNILTKPLADASFTLKGDFIYTTFINPNFINISFITSSTYNVIESVETHNIEPQEVFYKAIDKVQQSPLFNWTSNNIIYTGMHNMCTTMNITSTFIPFILTYWILTSIIYMLFDIEFTLLWKLHEKIHDLTESL